MEQQHLVVPFLLTLGAGLATGIGSAIAFFAKHTNKRLLSFSLGLSGGVMIYVSFVELFVQALEALSEVWDGRMGHFLTVVAFFAGMLLIGIIDRLVPSVENPHEAHLVEEMKRRPHNPKLMRMRSPSLSLSITFPRVSPSQCPFFMLRATGGGRFYCRCCPVWPSRSEHCWPGAC